VQGGESGRARVGREASKLSAIFVVKIRQFFERRRKAAAGSEKLGKKYCVFILLKE
jgi:hypothetical protein